MKWFDVSLLIWLGNAGRCAWLDGDENFPRMIFWDFIAWAGHASAFSSVFQFFFHLFNKFFVQFIDLAKNYVVNRNKRKRKLFCYFQSNGLWNECDEYPQSFPKKKKIGERSIGIQPFWAENNHFASFTPNKRNRESWTGCRTFFKKRQFKKNIWTFVIKLLNCIFHRTSFEIINL